MYITKRNTKMSRDPKAHIPPEIALALDTQREETGNKQYEINIPNVNPTLEYLTRTIFHWLAFRLMLGIIGSR